MDLATGKIKWAHQMTALDHFLVGCPPQRPGPNCPSPNGPDFDFGSSPILKHLKGGRDVVFKTYRLEVVPQFWLLTRNRRSRLFQQKTIPDVLKKVLTGLDVSYELQGDWKIREYVCQYQESDFNFACRLMEECGIYYFFKHSQGGHQMVI